MKEKQDIPEQLNVKRSEDFPLWMTRILQLAKVIDNRYEIKSMFVWMPYGYDMMLRIKAYWDKLFKDNGIKEMYFPLMVPVNYAEQNDSWWEGFKEEGFWAGKKEKQEFILRPTGEPAMYPMFSLWIRGLVDLPLRVYETVFSYRYETKQTRPLIRDREIGPWYEIHTVHATKEEAEKEIELARKMNDMIWEFLAIKPLLVKKPKWECFPGAEGALEYYTIMPNGKVIENGSLNNLGQAYAKKFNIMFTGKDGKKKYGWQTCTGNGERYLAAVIAQHGDDLGLVIPPNIAPVQIMIIPVFNSKNKEEMMSKAKEIQQELEGIRAEIDSKDEAVGSKYYEAELRGIPLRIEFGEREIKNNELTLFLRHTRTRKTIKDKDLKKTVLDLLSEIQNEMLEKSKKEMSEKIKEVGDKKDIAETVQDGKIASIYWCGDGKCYDEIVKLGEGLDLFGTDVDESKAGNCIVCKKKVKSKSYVANSF